MKKAILALGLLLISTGSAFANDPTYVGDYEAQIKLSKVTATVYMMWSRPVVRIKNGADSCSADMVRSSEQDFALVGNCFVGPSKTLMTAKILLDSDGFYMKLIQGPRGLARYSTVVRADKVK